MEQRAPHAQEVQPMAAPAAILQHRLSNKESLFRDYTCILKFTAQSNGNKKTVLDVDTVLCIRKCVISRLASTMELTTKSNHIVVEKPSVRSPAVLCF